MELRDAVVLVTGASSGIGAATARAAAAAGARTVLLARRAERIAALAEELPDSLAVPGDVTRPDDLEAAVAAGVEQWGRLDVLVNNAGQGLNGSVEGARLDDLRAVFELNVVGALAAMQAVIPVMRRQGAGSIVNVSSGTTLFVIPGTGVYAATKAALNTLSVTARAELADAGIVVSTVFPRITRTEFGEALRAGDAVQASQPGHPPERVAGVILDLIRSGDERAVLPPPEA